MIVAEELHSKCRTVEEDDRELLEEAWDDVSGARLNPIKVKEARMEEVDYVRKIKFDIMCSCNWLYISHSV